MEATRGAFVVGVPATETLCAGRRRVATNAIPTAGFDMPSPLPVDLPAPRTHERPAVPRRRARAPRSPVSSRSAVRIEPRCRARLAGSSTTLIRRANRPPRAALADLMSSVRGVAAPPEAITVVRGSQHGLYLAARALLRPGDIVAVEQLGYRPAWQALELAGATLVPIPVDDDGLDVDALEAVCTTRLVRAIYTTPHHQYPSTVMLTAARRERLLALAATAPDDRARGRLRLRLSLRRSSGPAARIAADRHGVVVYFGTLSKSLAPGLRLGYVVAPTEVAQQLSAYRSYVDGQGDHAIEHAIATLLDDGDVQRHTRRALQVYRLAAKCAVRRTASPAAAASVRGPRRRHGGVGARTGDRYRCVGTEGPRSRCGISIRCKIHIRRRAE